MKVSYRANEWMCVKDDEHVCWSNCACTIYRHKHEFECDNTRHALQLYHVRCFIVATEFSKLFIHLERISTNRNSASPLSLHTHSLSQFYRTVQVLVLWTFKLCFASTTSTAIATTIASNYQLEYEMLWKFKRIFSLANHTYTKAFEPTNAIYKYEAQSCSCE